MKLKKMTTLVLTGTVAASLLLGGCGSNIDSDAIVLTVDDEEITLGYMNFLAHYYQSTYDSIFLSYYGDDYWTSEDYADEDGRTMEESVKDSAMLSAEEYSLLDQHREEYGVEITDEELDAMRAAGDEFMSENDNKAINAMGATADYVAEMLYFETVAERMMDAIEDEVGNDLDINDYARRTFSYIAIDKNGYTDEDGEYIEYTEEDLDEAKVDAEVIAQEATEDFDGTVEDGELTSSTYSYGEDEASADEGGFDEAVIAEADQMKDGEISGLIDGTDYYYIIRLDSEDDQDAAESAMESDSSEMKSEHYTEVTDAWLEEADISIDEELWDKVKFTDVFEVISSDEEDDAEE